MRFVSSIVLSFAMVMSPVFVFATSATTVEKALPTPSLLRVVKKIPIKQSAAKKVTPPKKGSPAPVKKTTKKPSNPAMDRIEQAITARLKTKKVPVKQPAAKKVTPPKKGSPVSVMDSIEQAVRVKLHK